MSGFWILLLLAALSSDVLVTSTSSHLPIAHLSTLLLASSGSAVILGNLPAHSSALSKPKDSRASVHGLRDIAAAAGLGREYSLPKSRKEDQLLESARKRRSVEESALERRHPLPRRRSSSHKDSRASKSRSGTKWSRTSSRAPPSQRASRMRKLRSRPTTPSPSKSARCTEVGSPKFGVFVEREQELEEAMKDLDKWTFDVFRVDELSGGRALTVVGYTIFQERNLTTLFSIPPKILLNFLMTIEDHYRRANPYHNAIHAADVAQAVHVLLQAPAVEPIFSGLEVLAAITAAIVHDVNHPGLSNQYQIETGSELAILYNDKSVLESHSLATAFKLLQDPNLNIFAKMSKLQRTTVRKIIIDMVLSTDMAKHLTQLNNLEKMVAEVKVAFTGELVLANYTERVQVLENILHGSDIGNPSRPLPLYEQWAARITEEFYRQGEKQKQQGLEVCSMCSKERGTLAKSQVQFIDAIVMPFWRGLADLLHPHAEEMLDSLENNRNHFSALVTEGGDGACESD